MLVAVMAPHEAGFHLSRGNDATCTLQGFMIQLGQTSMFYNVCLSLYFLLVIVYNWKERMFRRLCLASHMLVSVLGAGLAFGAIPFIGPQFGVCGVLPPLTTSQWQVSLFYAGPVSFTLVVLAVATAVICYKVYQQQKKAKKWMANVSAKLSRRVFWQSFWYVMAFYMTLAPMLFTFYIEFESPQHYWLLVLAATLAPLQGFINFLVYFQRSRRKLFNSLCSPCKGQTNKVTSKKRPAVHGPRTKPIRQPECDDESDLKKTPVLSVQDNVATETTTENKLERSERDQENNALESDTRTTSLANGSES